MDGCPNSVSQKFTKKGFADHDFCVTQPDSVKKMGSKKGASAKHADSKREKGLQHPAPKLPPLAASKQVAGSAPSAQKAVSSPKTMPAPTSKKKTPASKKTSRVEGRGSRAEAASQPRTDRGSRIAEKKQAGGQKKASSAEPHPSSVLRHPSSTAELSAQVAALQEQIAALRDQLATSNPPLHHAVVAQREGGPPSDAHRAPLQPPPFSASSYQVSAFSPQSSAFRFQFPTSRFQSEHEKSH